MKRPGPGGFTAAAVLVVGIVGGVIGGAIASGGSTPAAPPVVLHQVAEEPTTAPSSAPADTATTPVSDAVIVEPAPGDTTTADRAKAEADRAKLEADRATDAADRAEEAPAPKPAPAATEEPVVTKPECAEGAQKFDPYIRDGKLRVRHGYVCRDGAWVVVQGENYKLDGGSDESQEPTSGKPSGTLVPGGGTPDAPAPADTSAADPKS